MNEKFSVDDFISPLENLEHVLEMLEGFYSDGRFEDMDDALELIESYKRAVSVLKGVQEWSLVCDIGNRLIEINKLLKEVAE